MRQFDAKKTFFCPDWLDCANHSEKNDFLSEQNWCT